jgi:hypothetical protein
VPSDAGVRAESVMPCPATKRAAVLLIETDSISLIGPNTLADPLAMPDLRLPRLHRRGRIETAASD